MQVHDALLHELDAVCLRVLLHQNGLIVHLNLHLLHSVLVGELFLLDPVRVVRDGCGEGEAENQETVFDDEAGDDELGPVPFPTLVKDDQFFRGENDHAGSIDDAEG